MAISPQSRKWMTTSWLLGPRNHMFLQMFPPKINENAKCILRNTISCHTMSYHAISYQSISYLYHIILVSKHLILYHMISCHIISYDSCDLDVNVLPPLRHQSISRLHLPWSGTSPRKRPVPLEVPIRPPWILRESHSGLYYPVVQGLSIIIIRFFLGQKVFVVPLLLQRIC